ncbi:MAG: hypothetical protein D8H91_04325 [Alloprevotella sp.]|nr:MAG: hypothetical protein D8H91_04325 [Alloprevotella sp.]
MGTIRKNCAGYKLLKNCFNDKTKDIFGKLRKLYKKEMMQTLNKKTVKRKFTENRSDSDPKKKQKPQ